MILQFKHFKVHIWHKTFLAFLLIVMYGCNNSEIKRPWSRRIIPFPQQNLTCNNDPNSALRQIFTWQTDTSVRSFIEYWKTGDKKNIFSSDTSSFCSNHRIILRGLKPECEYTYRIVNSDNKSFSESEAASFKTSFLPVWLDSYYTAAKSGFKINGKLLISNRKDPGMLVLLDSNGTI